MTLPPAYEILYRAGIRFVTNAVDGEFFANCPKCGRENSNFVHHDDEVVSWHCPCGESRIVHLRPAATRPAATDGKASPATGDDVKLDSGESPAGGGAPRADDDDKRKAFEEAMRLFPEEEPELQPSKDPAGGDAVPKDELFAKEDAKPKGESVEGPPTIADAIALRRALAAAGYVPIPLYGKVPPAYGKNNPHKGLAGWQQLTAVTGEMIDMWAKTWPDAMNTGALTRAMPTLDLDILNEDAARACEDLVRERCEEVGYVLVRIGLPPKRAIPFRTEEPFKKIQVNLVAANGSEGQKIEFLGDGQQVVVAGIHPATKRPYRWHGGEPGAIKREDLPCIREADAQALVDDLIELLVRDFGYIRAPGRPGKGNGNGNGNGNGGDRGGGGADGWQYLLDNIQAGRELHDSLRDLAAKMIRAGTDAGAVVNQLRALMKSSSAPHDERWQERYDDIPHLVKTAEKMREKVEPPPDPQLKPQPKPIGTSTIEETIAAFRKWLLLSDATPLLALLGAVAANYLPGDPVWLGVVAPGSSAKTEMLNSVSHLRDIHKTGPLTLPALLSGTPERQRKKTARGGLLREVGEFGIIVAKDFGSILSLRPDTKTEVLGALREVYDGEYTRRIGTEGGRQLYWKGKVGFIFGCTPVIDSHHSVIGAMGERFLLSRLAPEDDQFLHALKHAGAKTVAMRQELAESVGKLFASPLREPIPLSDAEARDLNNVVALVVALRGPIERDRHSREIENIYGKEGTGRLGLTLERLLGGLDALGVERETALKVIKRVAMDSVPPIRRAAYECVCKYHDVTTADVAIELNLPTNTARRALEDLAAYELVKRSKLSANKDQWIAINPQGQPAPKPAKPATPDPDTWDDDGRGPPLGDDPF